MLIINASATKNADGVRQAAGSNVRLKLDDAEAIKENKRCRICFTTGTKKLSNRKW